MPPRAAAGGTMAAVDIRPHSACLALVVAGAGASAQTALPPATLAEAVALAADAARSLAPPNARIEVVAGTLDPRLRLAPCDRIEPKLAAGARAWGPTRIALQCAQGAQPWRVFLPLTVKVWAPAVVAPQALAAGAVIDATAWKRAEVDWAADPQSPPLAAENLGGRSLARPLAAGQPARAADLRTRQWFAAGDTVRVSAGGDGYAVQADGTAVSNGVEGQPARVRLDGGRIVSGLPTGERRVELAL